MFGEDHVKYLGHVISGEGVLANNDKIRVVQEWPIPTCTTSFRGFLGLIGFYWHFIRDYGSKAAPLTNLLQKHSCGLRKLQQPLKSSNQPYHLHLLYNCLIFPNIPLWNAMPQGVE